MGKTMDVDTIVTPYTHDFSASLTVHTGGGYGIHSEWIAAFLNLTCRSVL